MSALVTHKALFEKLRDSTVIEKCERYAHWTLPQLMADFSETRGTSNALIVERDYQEIGALLVNHLASKLAGLLFPSNRPFYRIDPSEKFIKAAGEAGVKKEELSAALARLEMESCQNLFMNASYNQLVMLLKHLIISGNAALYRDSALKTCTVYGLQSFVVRRDGKGRLLDAVLREFTCVEALPLDVQDALKRLNKGKYSRPEQQVEVYTRVHRKLMPGGVMYEITQQVDTIPVGEMSTYPEHLCPWQFPTWNLIAGEHYGRGMVEDYAGGFARLSDLSESHALYAVEVMRVVHLVSNGSGTDVDDLASAETGQYVRGDAAAVQAHESGDARKLEQVQNIINEVFQRLARAFMYSANTRDAERVTAYELRQQALEAENALGGVYSSLAESIQVPLAHILMYEVKPSTLESVITRDMKVDIMAGIPALGRASDVQNLVMAVQEAATVVPPLAQLQQLDPRVDIKKVMDMIFAGRSVDVEALYKDQEVLDKEAALAQQAQQGQAQMSAAVDAASQLEQLNTLTQG